MTSEKFPECKLFSNEAGMHTAFSVEISLTSYSSKRIYLCFPIRFYLNYRKMAPPFVAITEQETVALLSADQGSVQKT